MTKLPAVPAVTTLADLDLEYLVDVSDFGDDPTGSHKRITHANKRAQSDLWLFPLTVAALATLGSTHADGDVVTVKNFSTAEDGGGGDFRLDTAGTFVITGTHTGGAAEAVLTDSTKDWAVNSLIGRTLTNDTNGESTTVTANTDTTITGVLSGGESWDTSDAYTLSHDDGGVVVKTTGGTNYLWRRVIKDGAPVNPQWWGAKGDTNGSAGNGTDDQAAIQSAAWYCHSLNATVIVKPILYLPSSSGGVGYRTTSTITVLQQIHVRLDAEIQFDDSGGDTTACLVIGETGNTTRGADLRHIVRVRKIALSDWLDEGCIGVKFFGHNGCRIHISSKRFTIGSQIMGRGRGFARNAITCGEFQDNKIHLDFTNETDGSPGFVTDNDIYGGSFSNSTNTRTGYSRYFARFTALDATPVYDNGNKFHSPSIELRVTEATDVTGTHDVGESQPILEDSGESWAVNQFVGRRITNNTDGSYAIVTANTATTITGVLQGGTDNDWDTGDTFTMVTEAVPFLMEFGNENEVDFARNEGNSPIFARCSNDSSNNVFSHRQTESTIEQLDTATGNIGVYVGGANESGPSHMTLREVFDSGMMHEAAVMYDGTTTHVPRVNAGTSGDGLDYVSRSNITFFVSEAFTTVFATNNEQLLDTAHTLLNGDKVYLTGADLPNGLLTGTLYYVVQKATNDFRLSLTLGGSAVTFSDDGTPTHTYHSRKRHLDIVSGKSVGINVDTSVAKDFVLERDSDATFGGRLMVRAYDADQILLLGGDTFTVDTGTEEIIPTATNHRLVVDDTITLTTSAADLPDPLAISTTYHVISVTADRFKISTTKGGTVVNITDAGTGTHTWTLTRPHIAGSFGLSWSAANFGGTYRMSGDSDGEIAFRVRDEVKHIAVIIAGGSSNLRIRRFKLHTSGRDSSPRTWVGYDEGQPGQTLATQSPTTGVYSEPRQIWNHAPSVSTPTSWHLTTSGAPGTWIPDPDKLDLEVVTSDASTLAKFGTSELDSETNKVDCTLPDGDYYGQLKFVKMTEASNSSTLTVTSHKTSDPETFTFDDTADYAWFRWTPTDQWETLEATAVAP